jgi:hypothetical protein
VEVPVEIVERPQQEEAPLSARVRRLQHRREADRVTGGRRLAPHTHGREPRLRHTALGEPAPHRHLVRHQVRGRRPDPGQPELLSDRGDHRHRPICRHGQHAIDPGSPRDGDHPLRVGEVDDVALVRMRQPDRLRVAIDGDHA